MFRISKSDDSIEGRDPEDETADRHVLPSGSASAVASTALRWLRKPQEPRGRPWDETRDERDKPPGFGLFKTPAGDDEAADDDELELVQPLDLTDQERDDPSGTGPPASPAIDGDAEAEPLREDVPASASARSAAGPTDPGHIPLEFDDDDDLDDFDELVTIDRSHLEAPSEAASFLPDIDLDPDIDLEDSPSADDFDIPPPRSAPEIDSEKAASEDIRAVPRKTDAELPQPTLRSPSRPVAERGADSTAPEPAGSSRSSARLTEAPIRPFDSSLSLQPIPELQTRSRSRAETGPPAAGPDAPAPALQVPSDDDEPATGLFDRLDDLDDADALPDPAPEADAGEREDLDLLLPLAEEDAAGLAADDLEPGAFAEPDRSGIDDDDEDELARLTDLLLHDDDDDDPLPSFDEHRRPEPDHSTSVLPLSKTLAHIATGGDVEFESSDPALDMPELEDADFLPAAFAPSPPQRKPEARLPTVLPADEAGLSPAQLALGIITNVPRLRRFAAAQIGEELEADRLVQITVKSALADPSILRPPADLGRALIQLLHQRRQEMLNAPAALPRLAEAAQAFEAALCRTLAGADQFEIHQFARGINSLDEPDRDVLLLVSLENFTYDQVAEIVRIPIERVMATVSGARMRLRQTLAADEAAAAARRPVIDGPHPREIEIHGYLDGELDSHHMAEVDALVEQDEDAADRLLHYGIQGDLIRRLYAPLLNRPIPGAMLETFGEAAKASQQRRVFPFGPRKALIAGAVALALGTAAAWLHGASSGGGDPVVGAPAAAIERQEAGGSLI